MTQPASRFAAVLTLVAASSVLVAGRASHPIEFWRAIVQQHYTPPPGSSVVQLSAELSQLLGSPDPELRDEIAYATLTSWIYQQRLLEPSALRALIKEWTGNLKQGVGSVGTDAVFRRSFSALILSVVVARDNAAPFLEAAEFHDLLGAALAYLDAERDLRGYDARTGWAHSAAHTADLLKFLSRSRYLDLTDQPVILDAIAQKLARAVLVFTHGEDERFARAVLSVVNRKDFDQDGFGAWLARTRPAPITTPRPDPAQLRGNQNIKNLWAKLEVLLSLDPQPSAAVVAARERVRTALRDLF